LQLRYRSLDGSNTIDTVSDSERRQRTISSAPRLTPEEVAGRTFATAFRGVSESDVRSFLKRVSDELATARGREQELMGTIDELETRLRSPQPLDEQALLDALGEETTRLLRSAREAAIDIRAKAEERASRLVHDAHEESERLKEESQNVLGVKTQEAEVVAQALLEEAEQRASDLMRVADERAQEVRETSDQHAEELRARVERESKTEIEDARERGQAMLAEAGELRERVIDDLARRRELLTGQLEELRTGRDRLLDAYRIVKRTFLEATEALAQVEARATAARSIGGADPAELDATVAAESDAARAAGLQPATPEPSPADAERDADDTPASGDAASEPAASEAPTAESEAPETAEAPALDGGADDDDADVADVADVAVPNLAAVDDLFARLRAGAREETVGAASIAPSLDSANGDSTNGVATESPEVTEIEVAELEVVEVEIDIASAESDDAAEAAVPTWLSERNEALAPLRVALVRQIKLAVGDEQNEVLDKVRRNKGKPSAASVLPDTDAQAETWAAVVLAKVTDAYRSARGADAGALPDDLAKEIARTMVEPLRDRLVAAIDDQHEPGETSNQVAERIGARYREWKNRSAEAAVEDALVGAYARGRYDAAADDAMFTWCTPPGGCCPDCADNALEPTRKGETFPTGQQYPPAHPGCRCATVSVDSDAIPSETFEAESATSS